MANPDLQAAEKVMRQKLDSAGTQYESVHAVQKARDAFLVTVHVTDPEEIHKAVVTRDELDA